MKTLLVLVIFALSTVILVQSFPEEAKAKTIQISYTINPKLGEYVCNKFTDKNEQLIDAIVQSINCTRYNFAFKRFE